MRLFFILIFVGMLGYAQENRVAVATNALQSVLSGLQQSVEKLSLNNEQLTARDKAIKEQLSQLQAQLERLEVQGNDYSKAAAKLQEKNPRRAQTITQMESENFDLDNRTQKSESTIKTIQQALGAGYQENQRLLLQLKGLMDIPVKVPKEKPGKSPAEIHLQKEKLRLLKMIDESKERQEGLHRSILDLQKTMPVALEANALAEQQILKEQIKDLDVQVASYPKENLSGKLGGSNQFDDTQLHQLEGELENLEQNYTQLKVLMEQMSKKSKNTHLSVADNSEEEKLQSSIEDLNHQGKGLMANLDDLRTQMVDLDKRKSHLETMIQQMQ